MEKLEVDIMIGRHLSPKPKFLSDNVSKNNGHIPLTAKLILQKPPSSPRCRCEVESENEV